MWYVPIKSSIILIIETSDITKKKKKKNVYHVYSNVSLDKFNISTNNIYAYFQKKEMLGLSSLDGI